MIVRAGDQPPVSDQRAAIVNEKICVFTGRYSSLCDILATYIV